MVVVFILFIFQSKTQQKLPVSAFYWSIWHWWFNPISGLKNSQERKVLAKVGVFYGLFVFNFDRNEKYTQKYQIK
jgi:hypothetical protein